MENKIEEMIFSGFGGQGVQVIGKLLVSAALDEDLNVSWLPSYGPEMRGGTSNCSVIVSSKEIGSPIVIEATSIIVMNKPSLEKFEPYLIPNGLLIMASDIIDSEPKREDIQVIKIPALSMANEIGNKKFANMILLGAFVKLTNIISFETLIENIKNFGKKEYLESNLLALQKGANYIKDKQNTELPKGA